MKCSTFSPRGVKQTARLCGHVRFGPKQTWAGAPHRSAFGVKVLGIISDPFRRATLSHYDALS